VGAFPRKEGGIQMLTGLAKLLDLYWSSKPIVKKPKSTSKMFKLKITLSFASL
jgi:hypothetical protein